jgi:hypothetical protein
MKLKTQNEKIVLQLIKLKINYIVPGVWTFQAALS